VHATHARSRQQSVTCERRNDETLSATQGIFFQIKSFLVAFFFLERQQNDWNCLQ